MSNHPSNIKGDVTKTIVVPYSEFPSKIKNAVQNKLTSGKSYDINKETGEPQYTGWSEAEYTEKVNEINSK